MKFSMLLKVFKDIYFTDTFIDNHIIHHILGYISLSWPKPSDLKWILMNTEKAALWLSLFNNLRKEIKSP